MRFCEREKWRESGEELCTPIRLENKQTKKKNTSSRVRNQTEQDWWKARSLTIASTLLTPLRQHCSDRCTNTTFFAATTL